MKNPNIYILLCVLGSILVFLLTWMPVRISISHYIIEDMFYYLQGARQINAGNVVSLDGINPTNGFHPLWMVLCCGVEGLAEGDKARSVHLALSLCALAFILTGLLLYLSIRKTPGKPLALPLTALFLFNYRMMTIPLGGLESGLNGLCIMLVVYLMVSRVGPLPHHASLDSARWGEGPTLLLGILLGLAYLSRMDAFLFGGVVLGWIAVRGSLGVLHLGCMDTLKRGLRTVAAGLASVVVVIPWFVFSWRTSHTLLPNSRVAIKAWTGHSWSPDQSWLGNLMGFLKERLAGMVEPANDLANLLGVWPVATSHQGGLRLFGGVVLLVAAIAMGWVIGKGCRDPRVIPLSWIPIYALAHTAYYVIFGRAGIRYLFPVIPPMMIYVGACAGVLTEQGVGRVLNAPSVPRIGELGTPPTRWRVNPFSRRVRRTEKGLQHGVTDWCVKNAPYILLLLGITIGGIDSFRKGYGSDRWHPLHLGLYEDLAPWIRENTPPGTRVGSFNAGILSYYSGRTVTNLDGVMNDSAIEAMRTSRLSDYIDRQRIDYLADLEDEINKFMGRFSGDLNWQEKWDTAFRVRRSFGGGEGEKSLVVLKKR